MSVLHSWCFRVSPLQCWALFFLHRGRFVDCTHKNSQSFCVFVNFPFISYGRSFLTKEHKCDYFFLRPLSLLGSWPKFFFFCVHIPNAIKVTKFRNIPMKLWFLKFQNRKFFCQRLPKSTWGLNNTSSNVSLVQGKYISLQRWGSIQRLLKMSHFVAIFTYGQKHLKSSKYLIYTRLKQHVSG